MPIWLVTQHKIMTLLAKFKNTLCYLPIKRHSSFIYRKAWTHESESVKIYFDAAENMGNSIEITVSNGKNVAQATKSCEPSV